MDLKLTEIEARVLGALIEKGLSTPEYYPLTLNSLTAACNQKSNRNPVLALPDVEVAKTLDELRYKHLAWEAHLAGSRVPKYEHRAHQRWELAPPELAVLAELLLRGPQTIGELRTRSVRMHHFESLEAVEEALEQLSGHAEGPFVIELERLPGRRENRFAHLLCGEPEVMGSEVSLAPDAAMVQARVETDRLAGLEATVQRLQSELETLRSDFDHFKKQFE